MTPKEEQWLEERQRRDERIDAIQLKFAYYVGRPFIILGAVAGLLTMIFAF